MKWLKGLLAASIGAVSNSVILVIADPITFSPAAAGGLKHLATVAVTSAVLAMAMYLKQSPLPA